MPSYNPKADRAALAAVSGKTTRPSARRTLSDKPKFYILDMFPYPSGAGLHVGHPEGYTATDILARYKRMRGFNVLHPMGWDAFGLPAEQYAIETGTHPAHHHRQATSTTSAARSRSLGFSYDWDREVDTTDPDYFRWTQWIFLQLFDTWYDPDKNKGRPIAELPIPPEVQAQGDAAVRRLSRQQTPGLPGRGARQLVPRAGHRAGQRGSHRRQVASAAAIPSSACRCGSGCCASPPTPSACSTTWSRSTGPSRSRTCSATGSAGAKERRSISIVADCDWTIRKSAIRNPDPQSIRVFTTRPDTLFGATYMVLAPEHPLVDAITTPAQKAAVEAYQAEAARKSDLERTELAKKKTGVFTGAYAINPVNERADPDLDRRLRAGQLRHRRDHGRARPTTSATSSSPSSSTCRSARSSGRPRSG